MPTHTATSGGQTTLVNAAASPVTLSIPPHAEPLVLVITSSGSITVSGQATSRPIDVQHT